MTRGRILVIDDDHIILEMLELALGKADFDVVRAPDGDLGLKAFHDHSPDLVIVDIAMPGIDGYQVVERIRGIESGAELPIIILTAHEQSVMRAYAEQLRANLYLTKPVTPRVLVAKINELLGVEES